MTVYDYWVLGIFFTLYAGYQTLYLLLSRSEKWMTRERIISQYRVQWYRNVLETNGQILAIQTIRNLEMVSTFLSSVTLLMMGGIISLFTANPEWMVAIQSGSYETLLDQHALAFKLLIALLMLIIAFFNFLSSLRVCFSMNFTLSVPLDPEANLNFQIDQIQRQAHHFAAGLRAVYYCIPPLIWVIDPSAMLVLTLVTTLVIFRGDFFRRTSPQQYTLPT